jgi:hypothetical protein
MTGELVQVGSKLGDPGSLPNPAAAAAALAALAYTADGVTGVETSASERRGRFTPMLKEWWREAGRSKVNIIAIEIRIQGVDSKDICFVTVTPLS